MVNVRVQSGETEIDKDGDSVFFGYRTSPNTTADDFTYNGTSPPSPPSPPPPPVSGQPFAVGTNGGTTATVTVYNANRTVRFTSTPFGSGFTNPVRVAVGDVTGDGVAAVVAVSTGLQVAPARVAVIDGVTGNLVSTPTLVPASYVGSLSVAVGDVNGDGVADFALGSNEGGSRVRIYSGGTFALLADVFVQAGASFGGRTTVALGDMNHDGKADLPVISRFVRVSPASTVSTVPRWCRERPRKRCFSRSY